MRNESWWKSCHPACRGSTEHRPLRHGTLRRRSDMCRPDGRAIAFPTSCRTGARWTRIFARRSTARPASSASRRLLALITLDDVPVRSRPGARRAMKAIAHLGQYLERFEAQPCRQRRARPLGGDAGGRQRDHRGHREAGRPAPRRQEQVDGVEETHLNDALERQGVEVVETDLGEYIVQLRQDRPRTSSRPSFI